MQWRDEQKRIFQIWMVFFGLKSWETFFRNSISIKSTPRRTFIDFKFDNNESFEIFSIENNLNLISWEKYKLKSIVEFDFQLINSIIAQRLHTHKLFIYCLRSSRTFLLYTLSFFHPINSVRRNLFFLLFCVCNEITIFHSTYQQQLVKQRKLMLDLC